MTDDDRLPDAAPMIARLPAESAVIVRARDPDTRAEQARTLIEPCAKHGVRLMISADIALARELGADGVHIPEAALRADPRRPEGPVDWFVTASAHSEDALQRAAAAGIDAAILSPVFPTASHPDAMPLGIGQFAELAARAGLPVFAMGGVTEDDFAALETAGAAGIAGIGFAG